MTEHTSHAPGTPNWVDLMASDVDQAKDFYAGLFGWELQDEFDGDGNRIYSMARLGGKAVAGIGGIPPGMEMPSVWNTYVATADLDSTAQAVEAAGGSVMLSLIHI